jgi:hypothetical protein
MATSTTVAELDTAGGEQTLAVVTHGGFRESELLGQSGVAAAIGVAIPGEGFEGQGSEDEQVAGGQCWLAPGRPMVACKVQDVLPRFATHGSAPCAIGRASPRVVLQRWQLGTRFARSSFSVSSST